MDAGSIDMTEVDSTDTATGETELTDTAETAL
jgi:hypothetical protein